MTHPGESNRQLFLTPTPNMREGFSCVDQCPECGTLVCHDAGRDLGECPACERNEGHWWEQSVPAEGGHIVGPFYVLERRAEVL